VAFFKQLKDAGITARDLTTLSVSIAEEEIRGIGADVLEGHLAAWNYYQTTDTTENKAFVEAYKAAYGADRVTADPIEAGYIAVYLWAAAVEKAGTTDVDAVREAAKGHRVQCAGRQSDDRRRQPAHLQDGPHRRSAGGRHVQGTVGDGRTREARSVSDRLRVGGRSGRRMIAGCSPEGGVRSIRALPLPYSRRGLPWK